MISVEDVVPGDVVSLQRGPVAFDMVVLRGANILLDESALTGESTPVAKRAIETSDSMYNTKCHACHTVFAGTYMEQFDDGDLALVTATSSFTVKGCLLTEVLAFKSNKPMFEEDVPLVVIILIIETIAACVLTIFWVGKPDLFFFFDGKFTSELDHSACSTPSLISASDSDIVP
jgi:P-type E1-E2 ATPase